MCAEMLMIYCYLSSIGQCTTDNNNNKKKTVQDTKSYDFPLNQFEFLFLWCQFNSYNTISNIVHFCLVANSVILYVDSSFSFFFFLFFAAVVDEMGFDANVCLPSSEMLLHILSYIIIFYKD